MGIRKDQVDNAVKLCTAWDAPIYMMQLTNGYVVAIITQNSHCFNWIDC